MQAIDATDAVGNPSAGGHDVIHDFIHGFGRVDVQSMRGLGFVDEMDDFGENLFWRARSRSAKIAVVIGVVVWVM